MRTFHRLLSLMAASLLAATAIAQNATPTAPARETPRPEDLEPGVNTSSPAQSPDRPSSVPAVGAAESTAPTPSSRSTASGGKPQAAAVGATPGAGANAATGAGATGADSASRAPGNNAAAAAPGAAKPAGKGKSSDRLELDTTQITGNRELPKVLYIVPWKRSDLGDLVGRPVNSLLDEVLTPVDRDVFQRENRYYRALTPGAAENDAQSAVSPKPITRGRPTVLTDGAPVVRGQGSVPQPASGSGSTKSPTGSGSAAPPPRDER